MKLTELAERVEKLTGRDLEINKLIPVALGYSWNGALSSANPDGRWQKSPQGPFLKDDDFTGSLDAAMTLAVEKWWLTLDRFLMSDDLIEEIEINRRVGADQKFSETEAAVIEFALRLAAKPADEGEADKMIGEIEKRFPNWKSYRDLVDCIDCTLHALRRGQ